ncbi:putative NADPH-quinone reductase (Modulator of drug activity B) [Bosea sp. LC85]|uniref:NAD(P)H-dependent oxidoreductase n=1 Tax=Bosea sp. LC85 TaxID=1502851 RepID=UPI0004E37B0A|nr:NAD(P)H-dependent oxidoreductase [Bosea sp. LC85]KFC73364.1 putative NADPH-quinone reductase (Modulator of drug activity B) [Bosea sp. LC85]
MPNTLILLFHSDYAASNANRALCKAVAELPGISVVDMQALYSDGVIDVDAEVARLLAADRIVLQFPVQWYSTPPLLKTWQDAVLTRMFYLAYEDEGRLLAGKPVLIAATAGNVPEAYTPTGQNRFSLRDLLRPLEATAHRCGLAWQEPFLIYGARKADAETLRLAGEHYAGRISRLPRSIPELVQ